MWLGIRQERIGERNYKGDEETFGGKGYVHYHCDGFTDMYICQNLSNYTFKHVQFIVCQLYLSNAIKRKIKN